jgi:hypothetical protein
MKYLVSFELFEAKSFIGKFSEEDLKKLNYTKEEPVESSNIIKTGDNNHYKIQISDALSYTNKFRMEYNPEINIILNDSKKHELFSKTRVFGLTWMETKQEFLSFIKNAFEQIYPKYLFYGVDNINDIDLYDYGNIHASDINNASKVYSLYVHRKDGGDFDIPYTLGKKYNIKEKRYDIYIFIMTLRNGHDASRIYQTYNFEYDQPTNKLIFKDAEYIGVDNFRYATNDVKKYIRDTFQKEDELRKRDIDNKIKIKTSYLDNINRYSKVASSDNLKKIIKNNKKT